MPTGEGLLTTLPQRAAPAHAALIVVDVQNDFLADDGFVARKGGDMTHLRASVPPLVRLIDAARQAGVLVVFVQAIYDDEYLSDAMRDRNRRTGLEVDRCTTGSWGADFYEVRPAPGEPVVVKHRYSAFMGTELDHVLKARGVRSLLLTGVVTDVCVESTARDGYFLDYYVTLVEDCCGAQTPDDHAGTLRRCRRDWGVVATTEEVIGTWAHRPTVAAGTAS